MAAEHQSHWELFRAEWLTIEAYPSKTEALYVDSQISEPLIFRSDPSAEDLEG